jgi:linoleate 10R-lipoxygenase
MTKQNLRDVLKVMQLASRPLPTDTGDGSYVTDGHYGGSLWADIRALGIEDASTIKDLIETTARGPLVDDKTMLMERIIRVIANLFYKAQGEIG